MRVRLVVNPLSRRGGREGELVRAELRRLGVEIAEQASEPIDAIVVAGGDGTFAHQIPVALAHGVPIGLVPLGTFNDLARTLAIPFDVSGACALVAAARTRAIDVAKVNEAYYVTEASIGISSRLARRQHPEGKRRFGLLAVIASLFAAVRYARPFHAEIEYDGRRSRVRAVQLTVANGPHFGGVITVADAAIDDGWLDCYVVAVKNFAEVIGVTGVIFGGRRRAVRGFWAFRSPAFEVRTHKPHHITADGEPAGMTPARFEVHPKALRVFVH